MSTIDPVAARLVEITEQFDVVTRKVLERDASGAITGLHEARVNVPRLVADGMALMNANWRHHAANVDAQGRFEQLDAFRTFCAAAVEHVPAEAAGPLRERFRQATNAIRLHYDDPSA